MFRAVALDKLTFPLQGMCVNPEVARRLPFDLACRYQALPVAEDDGHLTVAMAYPNDMEAQQAILAALPPVSASGMAAHPAPATCPMGTTLEQQQYSASALSGTTATAASIGEANRIGMRHTEVDTRGMSVYLVRGEPVAIDSLLADVWPGRARRALRLLVVDMIQGRAGLHDYAQALGRLLGARASSITCDDATAEDWSGPLGRLLLVVQGDDDPSGPAALACAVRLAQLSGAAVTVLGVVPPGPENGLATLLATKNTAVGQAAQRLVQAGIAATLRLRQGSLDQQLHREVIETDYDVVVVGSKPILGRMGMPDSLRSGARPATSSRKKGTDHVCGA